MNYKGSRYNADVHNALDIIKQYNQPNQPKPVDEAPYSMVSRVKDATKGVVPGSMNRMAKGRVGAGRLANDLNKQYQTFLGTRGHQNQKTQTVQDLTDFFTKFKVDPSAYFAKAAIAAGEPTTVITKKQSDNVILQIGQQMASSGQVPPGMGGTEDPATAGKATAPATAGGAAAKTVTGAGAAGAAFGRKSSGAPATTGTPGAAGTPGTPETPGATTGATGATGEPGAAGEPGTPGAAGEPGTPGAAGEPGTPGAAATSATDGAAGEPEKPAAPAQKFNNGDEISYVDAKGIPKDGIFVQYLDTKDAEGDPQAQVRQPNQTDAQAYAIDAASIGPKGSPPVNNDAANASTPAQNKVLAQVEKLNDNDRVKLKNAIGRILTSGAAKASTRGAAA